MPEGDLKLAVRLAITMGWNPKLMEYYRSLWVGKYIDEENSISYVTFPFNPFTDASIPYGLIGRGVFTVTETKSGSSMATVGFETPWAYSLESKTHAIINAYCAADPMGHWAKFMETK